MAGVIEGQIKETLTCKICYQVLDNPKTLPCMHTYCCGCLEKLVIKVSEENRMKCPECRQEHVLPEDGVHGLKVSFTTKTLAEILKVGDADKSPLCDSCKVKRNVDVNAAVKCLECNKNLCKSCSASHDEFTNGHTTVDLTGDKSEDMQKALETVKDRAIHCQKHNTALQIYCQVDKCVVCPTCYVIEHSGHACMDMQKAAKDNVKRIKELLIYGENLAKHYETAINDTHRTKNNMETMMNDAVSELTNDMNAAIQHIRDKYAENINAIEEKKNRCTKQTIAHLGHLELQKSLVESMMNQLSTVKDYGHSSEIASMTPEIDSKLEQWKNVSNVKFDSVVQINVRKGKLYKNKVVFACIDEGSENERKKKESGDQVKPQEYDISDETSRSIRQNKNYDVTENLVTEVRASLDRLRERYIQETIEPTEIPPLSKVVATDNQQGQTIPLDTLHFTTPGGIKVSVYKGDITAQTTDAIVSASNAYLKHGGGVTGAIVAAGGYKVQKDSDDLMKRRNNKPIDVSDTVHTIAPDTRSSRLKCKYIIHAVGPRWDKYRDKAKCKDLLTRTFYNSLKTASSLKAESVTIPAISSGIFGVPRDVCVESMYDALISFSQDRDKKSRLKDVRFVNIDDETTRDIVSGFSKFLQNPRTIAYESITLSNPDQYGASCQDYRSHSSRSYASAASSVNGARPKGTYLQQKGASQTN